jgi:hypothetical protein
MEVELRLPAGARGDVAAGDPVRLRSVGSRSRTWEVSLTRIGPADDQLTRTVPVYIEVEQPQVGAAGLAPGTFVEGTVRSTVETLRWIVPRRSLQAQRLLVVRAGRIASMAVEVDFAVEQQFPELGLADTQWMVLATPMREGELIVVDAARSLAEGSPVRGVPVGSDQVAVSGDAQPLATGATP